jgi:arylmalonate decarboxylase
MIVSRRTFVSSVGAAGIVAAPRYAFAQSIPTAGLIFPPLDYPIPPAATMLFPDGLRFISNGVGFNGMTIESYNEAIPRVLPRAADLAAEGADLISVFGSSITFYKGARFHEDLIRQVKEHTGLPATTQSAGLLDGLRHVNAKRIVLATAYTDEVMDRLRIFLEEHGFEVLAARGMGYVRVPDGAATHDVLLELGESAYSAATRADAVVMSCGALRTIDVLAPLETVIGVPVVSSTPHGLWHCARMLGVESRIDGFGMVMAS